MQSLISSRTTGTIIARKGQNPVHFGTSQSGVEFAAFRIVVDRPIQKNVITSNPTNVKILKSAKNGSRVDVSGNLALNVETKGANDMVYRANKLNADHVRYVNGYKPKAQGAAEPETTEEVPTDIPELTDEVSDPSLG
jgi:hypothetical protein